MKLDIAITTYNRRLLVPDAVHSALVFLAGTDGRVILVDDGSTDGTTAELDRLSGVEIEKGRLVILRHDSNSGVTSAKNSAIVESHADWVIILDSGDVLLTRAATAIFNVLREAGAFPIVFFRCCDSHGKPIGVWFDVPQHLDLRRYLAHSSYGEVLVAFNRRLIRHAPYDEDLRGYEGLGCARIIATFGPALLAPMVARQYNRTGTDRLSSPRGRLDRAALLGRGHFRLAREFSEVLEPRRLMLLRLKGIVYVTLGYLWSKLANL